MTPLKSLVKDVLIEPKHGAGFYEKVISVQDLKDWLYEMEEEGVDENTLAVITKEVMEL